MRNALLTGLILLAVFYAGTAILAQDKKLTRLSISFPSVSGAQAVLWVAQETGIFRQNGLDAELIYIGGGPRSMAALLSGRSEERRVGKECRL